VLSAPQCVQRALLITSVCAISERLRCLARTVRITAPHSFAGDGGLIAVDPYDETSATINPKRLVRDDRQPTKNVVSGVLVAPHDQRLAHHAEYPEAISEQTHANPKVPFID
jgi:hypothetical protein